MDKGGFLRIVEASIAIFLIMGVLFISYNKSVASNEPDLSERARQILDEMSKDSTLRGEIISNTDSSISNFIRERIPEGNLEFEFKICESLDSACGKSTYTEGNIYSAERIISSTLTNPNSKKVRLFIWRV